jgi:hypothetical protein
MKKYINKIFVLLAISVFLGSCEEQELTILNPNATTIATLSANDVVLEKANIGQDALTVTWTKPDFGYSAAASYQLLVDLAGGDFSTASVISTGQVLSYTFETEELNKILIGLGVEPDAATELQVKVKAILSSSTAISSDANTLIATAYADALDLSSPWGIVGSAYNDWGATPDAPFYKVQGSPNVYVAYVTLLDGEWKIRKDSSWDVNYGDDGLDGNLNEGGANIPATAGTYKIVFDEAALTYTVEAYTWGLVGDATTNSWDGPDMPLTYDPFTDTWRAQVKLNDGEFKVRLNNDWGTNYGDDGLDGTLDPSGTNIPVTFGYYEIIVNLNDLTYTLEKTDIWGVVGSGYNDWGATPDFQFIPDYGVEGVYHANNITLLDGEIKFRTNSDWGLNYGDTGLDGILEEGGDNIPSTAGTYDITLDFSNPSVPTYTITAK